ncbi:hypothetical protein CS8_019120 [Cupriavidus sp. 8B]
MTEHITVRRAGAGEAAACIEPRADVLIDCVEGGASVSFMLPLPREKATQFRRGVADGVARGERVLLIAQDGEGQILGTDHPVDACQPASPRRRVLLQAPLRGSAQSALQIVTLAGNSTARMACAAISKERRRAS